MYVNKVIEEAYSLEVIGYIKVSKKVYKVKKLKDVQDRVTAGGGTKFGPVFEYLNNSTKKYFK